MKRYVGVDVASERHFAAVVDETQAVTVKPFSFGEDGEGYASLFSRIGPAEDTLVAMEATGHYWKNLFAALVEKGFGVTLINPLRTRRYAEEDMQRAKTDSVDALRIARFACEKRVTPTALPPEALQELRELARHRERLSQEVGDKTRQLHRLVDLGFPEFTRYVKGLDTSLATALLLKYPNAEAFAHARERAISNLKYSGQRMVGLPLAKQLLAAAKTSVGRHHGPAYRLQVKHLCEDMDILRGRLASLDRDIASSVREEELGKLLLSIDGLGELTVARLLGEVGDPAHFKSGDALAAYVGAVPGTSQSGKGRARGSLSPLGNARLRKNLWMPTLVAVKHNPWLHAFYERLRAQGKKPKVALMGCMRKLLLAIYSVAKNRKAFVPLLPSGATP